jgi:hypothetical protein
MVPEQYCSVLSVVLLIEPNSIVLPQVLLLSVLHQVSALILVTTPVLLVTTGYGVSVLCTKNDIAEDSPALRIQWLLPVDVSIKFFPESCLL